MKAKFRWLAVLALLVVPVSPRAEILDLTNANLPFSIATTLTAGRTYTFTFSLFDSGVLNEGKELWRERRAYAVPASREISHHLGSVYPFSDGMSHFGGAAVPVDFTRQLWIQVQAGSFVRRVALALDHYALSATGVLGLRAERNALSPNMLRGNSLNSAAGGVSGAAVSGGGMDAVNGERPDRLHLNEVQGDFGAIGGGIGNLAGHGATVLGGRSNVATGDYSVIVGAGGSDATGAESSVMGGCGGIARGDGASVVGGCANTALGYRSFASGEDGKASRRGMFVWSATDDKDPDGGEDPHYNRVYESGGGFPRELIGTTPNPLLKDMQFWVKSPGGAFFVTGQDLDGKPVGVRLMETTPASGVWAWGEITQSPRMSSLLESGPETTASSPPASRGHQALALDLSQRVTAGQVELAANRAEVAALQARIDKLESLEADLRRLLAADTPAKGGHAGLVRDKDDD